MRVSGGGSTTGNADGTLSTALFYNPHGIAVDSIGMVYFADTMNNVIRMITTTGCLNRVGVGQEIVFIVIGLFVK